MFAIRFAECNHFSINFGHIAQWIFNTSSRVFPRLARLIVKLANKNGLRKCQEPPRTDKSQKLTNANLRTTHYSTPSTKLDPPRRTLPTIRGRRCSRRMAHSDYIKYKKLKLITIILNYFVNDSEIII